MDIINSPPVRYQLKINKSTCQEEKENQLLWVSRPKLKRETLSLSDVPAQYSTERAPYKRKRIISDSCSITKFTNKKPCFKENVIEQNVFGLQFKIFEDTRANEKGLPSNVHDSAGDLYNILEHIERRSEGIKMQLLLDQKRAKDDSKKYWCLEEVCKKQRNRLEILQSENSDLKTKLDLAEKRVFELNNENVSIKGKLESSVERSCMLENDLIDLKKLVSKSALNRRRSSCSLDRIEASRLLSPRTTSATAESCISESITNHLLKVNHCLEESNVSQLQKMLLSFTMENEILNSKLEEVERSRALYSMSPMNHQAGNMERAIQVSLNERSQAHFKFNFNNDTTRIYPGKQEDETRTVIRGLENDSIFQNGKATDNSFLPRLSMRSDKGCQSVPAVLFSPFHVIKEVRFSFEDSGYLNITPNNGAVDKENDITNITSPFSFSPKWKSSTPK